MGQYDFDKVVERRSTGSLKYDALAERYGNPDLLPLWVADMDFETPDFITDAIKERLNHPLFGYSVVPEEYWKAIIDWNLKLHGWKIQKDWLRFVPGVVKAIGMVINVFSKPGDKIIIQPPVYHIFRMVVEGNDRVPVMNPLVENPDGSYGMNLSQLEEQASSEDCKILILSNPHNPAGIVWNRDTLREVADICHRHGVLVISDEIHSDMTLWGARHIPFATVSPEAEECSITFAAPSKTFNIPGIVSAYAVIPNRDIRDRFYKWLDANELSEPTVFAPLATIAAYTKGEGWRREMLRYVEGNIELLLDFLQENIPEIKAVKPGASFLVWLDCRGLSLSQPELVDLFQNKARLALNDGAMFGPGGEGFMRINVATPRQILKKALHQLKEAVYES